MIAYVYLAALALVAASALFIVWEKRQARKKPHDCAWCVQAHRARSYADMLRDAGADLRIVATAERRARAYERKAAEFHA